MRKQRIRKGRKARRRLQHAADRRERDRDYYFANDRGNVLCENYQDCGVRGPGAQKRDPANGKWFFL